jgi:hypothetical protein
MKVIIARRSLPGNDDASVTVRWAVLRLHAPTAGVRWIATVQVRRIATAGRVGVCRPPR